jgi:hypothetical protein
MNVRAVGSLPVVILGACWTGAVSPHGSTPEGPAQAAADPTLARDVERVETSLAGPGGEPFTAVEIVGWTANRAVVYRTAICDPDELGGRGPYCTIEVCEAAPRADASTCETVLDETVGALTAPFDRAKVLAAVEAAEAGHHATARGQVVDPATITLDTDHGDLWAKAPDWFGPTRWRLLTSEIDADTRQRHGYTGGAVTSAWQSPDGACLGYAVTVMRSARYESVTGSIRTALAAVRCR